MSLARSILRIPLISDNIAQNLHPTVWWKTVTAISHLSRDERRRGFPSDKCHQHLFDLILKDYSWAKHEYSEYGANLFLIGNIDPLYYVTSNKAQTYLMLFADDMSGDLRFDKQKFLESLQPHTQINSRELRFTSGLTLNVHSILYNTESTPVDPERLF